MNVDLVDCSGVDVGIGELRLKGIFSKYRRKGHFLSNFFKLFGHLIWDADGDLIRYAGMCRCDGKAVKAFRPHDGTLYIFDTEEAVGPTDEFFFFLFAARGDQKAHAQYTDEEYAFFHSKRV